MKRASRSRPPASGGSRTVAFGRRAGALLLISLLGAACTDDGERGPSDAEATDLVGDAEPDAPADSAADQDAPEIEDGTEPDDGPGEEPDLAVDLSADRDLDAATQEDPAADGDPELDARDGVDVAPDAGADTGGDPNYGTVTALAGSGVVAFGDGGDGLTAQLSAGLTGAALDVDASGVVYVADRHHNKVRRYDPTTGTIEAVAGSGFYGPPFAGLEATTAWLFRPAAVARAPDGGVYFSDTDLPEVLRVNPTDGLLEAVAGRGPLIGENLPGTSQSLCLPFGLTVDAEGNLYYSDRCRHQVRRLGRSTGTVTTVAGDPAGTAGAALGGLGEATSVARLREPLGLTVVGGAGGTLYVADRGNDRIVAVDLGSQTMTLVADVAGVRDLDAAGAELVAATDTAVLALDPGGVEAPLVIAGGGDSPDDGVAATSAELGNLEGIAYDASRDRVLVLTDGGSRLRTFEVGGTVTTLAGGVDLSETGLPALDVALNQPCRLSLLDETVYFSDNLHFRVAAVHLDDGAFETVVGLGRPGAPAHDQALAEAALTFLPCPLDGALTVLSDGSLVVAQAGDGPRLWRVGPERASLEHFAGNGSLGLTGDGGAATEAALSETGLIEALLRDSDDRIYVVTRHRIRRIEEGLIEAFAGDGGEFDAGDGGPATAASFARIRGVAFGPDDTLWVNTGAIRRIDVAGLVATEVTSAPLGPLAVGPDGRLYVAESSRIVRVSATAPPVVVAGGTGTGDSGDDGPATEAQFGLLSDFGFLTDGRMVVVDSLTYRLRIITPEGE